MYRCFTAGIKNSRKSTRTHTSRNTSNCELRF